MTRRPWLLQAWPSPVTRGSAARTCTAASTQRSVPAGSRSTQVAKVSTPSRVVRRAPAQAPEAAARRRSRHAAVTSADAAAGGTCGVTSAGTALVRSAETSRLSDGAPSRQAAARLTIAAAAAQPATRTHGGAVERSSGCSVVAQSSAQVTKRRREQAVARWASRRAPAQQAASCPGGMRTRMSLCMWTKGCAQPSGARPRVDAPAPCWSPGTALAQRTRPRPRPTRGPPPPAGGAAGCRSPPGQQPTRSPRCRTPEQAVPGAGEGGWPPGTWRRYGRVAAHVIAAMAMHIRAAAGGFLRVG